MKIAQICPYDFSRHGGVKTHILQLSHALRSLGHEVHIIAPNGLETVSQDCFHSFGKNYSLPFLGTKIDLNAALGSEYRKVKNFLRKENFDLIHFHTIWNPVIPFQILFLSEGNKIATFHDTPKNNFIGKFLGRFIMPLMARLIFTRLNGIISVSESQAHFIKRFSKRKINIIPNGISISEDGLKNKTHGDPNQLLFLGRLEPRKGLMSSLKAFELIHRNTSVTINIAGEGDQMSLARKFVQDKDLMNVLFLGKVNDETKGQLLDSCGIYLASAEYGESFGIVLLEAMSHGTLLAGYANEGYKNVLSSNQLNYFSEPGDVTGLANNIQALINLSQKEVLKLREEGFLIAEKHNWKKLVTRIIEVYRGSN